MDLKMDQFEIATVLGKGMFGTVYLVRRKKDTKPYVIKEQILDAAKDDSYKLILSEIQCLKKMRHPNIVAYHGAWREDNRSFILMEYVSRGTLKELLERRDKPLSNSDSMYLFSQITLGVHHIHSKKILHRDLKPENIMLTGLRGDIIKIGDFGVSKILQEDTPTCRAGSYYYMAPEMLFHEPYDFKCDIWSMGVILYEMVTKRLPFPATDPTEIMELVRQGKPEPLESTVSSEIVNLISKMLRRRTIYRPSAHRLVLCPFLVPFIIRVYSNVGRITNLSLTDKENFGFQVFLNFLNPPSGRRINQFQ